MRIFKNPDMRRGGLLIIYTGGGGRTVPPRRGSSYHAAKVSEPGTPSFRARNTQFQSPEHPVPNAWNTQFQTPETLRHSLRQRLPQGQRNVNHIKTAPLFLDYRLDKVLSGINSDTTPQQKSEIVQQIADILSEIQNPVILSDYIKNTSFKLNLDEEILKTQVQKSKYKNSSFENQENEPQITISRHASKDLKTRYTLMENNLIKLAFVANTPEKRNFYAHAISAYKPHDEANLAIIASIDKTLGEVNNVDELAKKLFCEFYNNTTIQQKLSDEIFSSTEYENLDYENYIQAVNEIFERLNSIKNKLEKHELRQKIKDKSLSEDEKLKILYKQFEANRMETI